MKKVLLLATLATMILLGGCKKDSSSTVNQDHLEFKPVVEVKINNGMLVFDSKSNFDVFVNQIAESDPTAVDKWEQSIGIQTPRNVFNQVVRLEDSISKHYESLPEKEQEYFRNQPVIHSDYYIEALSKGWIREVKEVDGNVYFDYNLSDNSMNGVVNMQGLVKVENLIFQFTPDYYKILLNGDEQLIPLLITSNEHTLNENIVVEKVQNLSNKYIKSGVNPGFNWTVANVNANITSNEPSGYGFENGWLVWDKNWLGNYQKRCKVWIDGHSNRLLHYGDYGDYCSPLLECVNTIRAEYQTKNFWGNWVYPNSSMSLSFTATWNYRYAKHNVQSGCGTGAHTDYYYVEPYECGIQGVNCATSPYTKSFSGVNNAYINITPHGGWQASGAYYYEAFKVYYMNLDATFGGIGFDHYWNN